MRLLVLWSKPSGYLLSELKSLHELGIEINLIAQRNENEAPFEFQTEFSYLKTFKLLNHFERKSLSRMVHDINPDVLLICSWNNKTYLRIARKFSGIRILFMDNQWHRTLKQICGVILQYFIIKQHFDGVLLPGARQEKFAKLLGFKSFQIAKMGYSADVNKFLSCKPSAESRKFLYIGRLVQEKGIELLLNGYASYREMVEDPWELRIIGNGKFREWIIAKNVRGVRISEFIQPPLLPSEYSAAGCFVLASTFEPWGLVLHEAAACGLPIICSDACGASDDFVEQGVNGFVFKSGIVAELSTAMVRIHNVSISDWNVMSEQSRRKARRITPEIWARSLVNLVIEIQNRRVLK